MSGSGKSKSLLRAANDTLKVYGTAFILASLAIVFLPNWLRWCGFYAFGILFVTSVLGPFVEDWKPRSRVQANGKAVFITGCDSGFGHMLALRLDDMGLSVFAGCLLPEEDGAKTLRKSASSRLQVVHIDVTSEESIEKAQKYVSQKLKENKLWSVINNAGMNEGGDVAWTNSSVIQRVLDVNTMGPVRVTKAFLPLLIKCKGRMVTVCSAAGRSSYPGMVPYCMSKCAAISFCEGLRMEMYRFGVKVVTIEPWMYKTSITNEKSILKNVLKTWESAPEEVRELYAPSYFERFKKNCTKLLHYSISDKPEQVVDCLEEAVMAMHPKYSYNPGTFFSRLSFWLLSRLPRQISDVAVMNEIAN